MDQGQGKSDVAGSGKLMIHGTATRTRSKTGSRSKNGAAVRYVLASSALGDGDDSQIVNLSVPLELAREMVRMQRDIEQQAQQKYKPAW